MKIVLYSFMTLVVLSDAFGKTAKHSWSDIKKDKSITIIMPAYTDEFGPEKIFNICHENGEFKSIKPVKVCTDYIEEKRGIPDSEIGLIIFKRCSNSVETNISIPQTSIRQECIKKEAPSDDSSNMCLTWKNVFSTLPIENNLNIIFAKGSERYGDQKFMKKYTIPECRFL